MKDRQIALLVYLGVMTVVGFAAMYHDKKKAEKHKWRTPEAVLFLIAIIGGSLGTFLGMWVVRHKTKHWYFVLGMPLILGVHAILLTYLFGLL